MLLQRTLSYQRACTTRHLAELCRYTAQMDERGITHNLHLFVDTVNAPASAIFETVNSVCEQVDAAFLVMAANHRVRFFTT